PTRSSRPRRLRDMYRQPPLLPITASSNPPAQADGRSLGREVRHLDDLANLNHAFTRHFEKALGRFDRVIFRFQLENGEASNQLLRFNEWPIDHREFPA